MAYGSAAAWPSANRAIYAPVWVPDVVVITKLAVHIGSATSGNIDIGVYTEYGVRLVSTGSTAAGSINTTQLVDVTDIALGPGVYYLAAACDNTTVSLARGNVEVADLFQVKEEDAAFPLPATANLSTAISGAGYTPNISATTRIPVL
jgi:hypothetical protein